MLSEVNKKFSYADKNDQLKPDLQYEPVKLHPSSVQPLHRLCWRFHVRICHNLCRCGTVHQQGLWVDILEETDIYWDTQRLQLHRREEVSLENLTLVQSNDHISRSLKADNSWITGLSPSAQHTFNRLIQAHMVLFYCSSLPTILNFEVDFWNGYGFQIYSS